MIAALARRSAIIPRGSLVWCEPYWKFLQEHVMCGAWGQWVGVREAAKKGCKRSACA